MTGDAPPDVGATPEALLSAVTEDPTSEAARSVLETARTITRNKVSDIERRERLSHGCERALAALAALDEPAEPALAAEYARATLAACRR